MPIDDGMVKAHAQAFAAQRRYDLFHKVAVQHGSSIVIGNLRIMQGKPFVMFGSEDYITASRLFCQTRPLLCEAFLWLEQGNGSLRVGVRIDLDALLNPLHPALGSNRLAVPGTGQTGIKPPMDEHAEPSFPPPFHACIALGRSFSRGCGCVQGECCGVAGSQNQAYPGRDFHPRRVLR